MNKTISLVMVFLIVLSTFSILAPQTKAECEVITLPAGAWHPHGFIDPIDSSRLDRIDLDPLTSGDQQCVTVEPGEAVTIDYSAWLMGNPGEIRQLWFVYSWASSYPPWDAYTPLFDGHPAGSGTVVSDIFSVAAPSTPGMYKVWLCVESKYYMEQAVAEVTEEPTMLPHAIITVAEPDQGTWVRKADMPTPRSHMAAVALEGRIYVIGGTDTSAGVGYTPTDAVEIYDPSTDSWSTGTSTPIPLCPVRGVVVENKIYVFNFDNNQTFCYDPTSDTWTEVAPIPCRLENGKPGWFGVGVVDGKIYVAKGDLDHPTEESWTYYYDPATDTWSDPLSPIPYPHHFHNLVGLGGKLYTIGGADPTQGGRIETNRVDVYDTKTDSWELDAIPRMSYHRGKPAASVMDGKIYAVGGWNGYTSLSSVEAYDPTTNSWTNMAPMSIGRYWLATAVVSGKIYAIGGDYGGAGGHLQSLNEEFTPPGWTPPVEEITFFPPYQEGFGNRLFWDMWNAFAKCSYSTDNISGVGHIKMDNYAYMGLGKAHSWTYFGLNESWTSESTGVARIIAGFNITGFMRTATVSIPIPQLPGGALATATLNASISVKDKTIGQEICRKDKIIFQDKLDFIDFIPRPVVNSSYYDDISYSIHDLVTLQEGHDYTWTFGMKMEGTVASVAWGAAFAQGNITATLNQVRIEPSDPWTPPPEEPPTTEDMMYIGVSCPVSLLVTDPAGRRIGFDPVLQLEVNEIPNGWYSGVEHEAQLISISEPIWGDYEVELYGTDNGNYTLFVVSSLNGTLINVFDFGGISHGETCHYTASISPSGEIEVVSWEYVFEDTKRGTMLKISTDDKYFQFIAPDKEFSIKEACIMVVCKHSIFIWHKDEEIKLVTIAIGTRIDFCFAYAKDMQTGDKYLLIDKPGTE